MGFMGQVFKLWDKMGQFIKKWDLWDGWEDWAYESECRRHTGVDLLQTSE